MVTRPRLPSKGLPLQWLRFSLVRPLDGNALISALPGIKTMFLIVSNFISASSIFFLSFQGQRLQKKAIYTNDYQSVMLLQYFFYHFKVNDCRRKLYTLMTTNQLCQNLG